MNAKKLWLVALTPLLLSSVALAEGGGDNACSDACPSGQVRVGFADGGNANCVCMPEGSGMQDALVEPGGEPQDGDS